MLIDQNETDKPALKLKWSMTLDMECKLNMNRGTGKVLESSNSHKN